MIMPCQNPSVRNPKLRFENATTRCQSKLCSKRLAVEIE